MRCRWPFSLKRLRRAFSFLPPMVCSSATTYGANLLFFTIVPPLPTSMGNRLRWWPPVNPFGTRFSARLTDASRVGGQRVTVCSTALFQPPPSEPYVQLVAAYGSPGLIRCRPAWLRSPRLPRSARAPTTFWISCITQPVPVSARDPPDPVPLRPVRPVTSGVWLLRGLRRRGARAL